MQAYVLGFLFSRDRKQVVLIRKNKPDWQKGKLNGVGGKVEDTDGCDLAAMRREFLEETGVKHDDWVPFAEMHSSVLADEKVRVHCFWAIEPEGGVKLPQITDELVGWMPVNKLDKQAIIPQLRWLVPLALDETILHADATLCPTNLNPVTGAAKTSSLVN